VGEFRPRSLPGTLYLCGIAVLSGRLYSWRPGGAAFLFVGCKKTAIVEVCANTLFHNFYFLLRGLEGL
jgi:hypothetical protein